jgi:hypothetical protein
MLGKRFLIQKLGLVSDQYFFLDSHMMVRQEKGVERLGVYSKNINYEYYNPITDQNIINSFPKRYVYQIDNPYIDPVSGYIYDQRGIFIAESSAWNLLRQFYSWPKPFIKKLRTVLPGTYIYIDDIGYYHWLVEDLSVFIAAYNLYPEAKIICPKNPSSWLLAFLQNLDIEPEYIDVPVGVERLIMVGKTAGQGNPLAGVTPHPKDIDTLRDYFQPFMNEQVESTLLFISRTGESRCPSNISEVESFVSSKGYQVINSQDKLSIYEQVSLYSSAKKIVGIHGGALANTIWCASGTEIVELASPGYLPGVFSMIASIRSNTYKWVSYGKIPTDPIDLLELEKYL